MRKNFGAKPNMYPMPVLIIATYDENGNADAMNAAWGGITGNTEVTMCLSKSHKTVKNILKKKAFTISMGEKAQMEACDYVGIVSGNEEEHKIEKAGFTLTRSEFVDAPVINELALCLECKMKSYNEETECMVGEIVNVSVDERALTNGKVDVKKLEPITFDPFHSKYYVLGEEAGNAFKDGQKLK